MEQEQNNRSRSGIAGAGVEYQKLKETEQKRNKRSRRRWSRSRRRWSRSGITEQEKMEQK
jgi:hypothetical protein